SENDYWTFDAVAGDTVLIDTDFPGSTASSKLRFYLIAPDGSTVADFLSDNNSNYASSGPISIQQSGAYIVRIVTSNTYLNEYLFRVTRVAAGEARESESNDSVDTADALTFVVDGDERIAWISGIVPTVTDRDFFSLGTVEAGE